jgi:hypothetical protein
VPNPEPYVISPELDKWHWGAFRQLEELWADIFLRLAPKIQFEMFDITPMSEMREDAHPWDDCLHYCEPGMSLTACTTANQV